MSPFSRFSKLIRPPKTGGRTKWSLDDHDLKRPSARFIAPRMISESGWGRFLLLLLGEKRRNRVVSVRSLLNSDVLGFLNGRGLIRLGQGDFPGGAGLVEQAIEGRVIQGNLGLLPV